MFNPFHKNDEMIGITFRTFAAFTLLFSAPIKAESFSDGLDSVSMDRLREELRHTNADLRGHLLADRGRMTTYITGMLVDARIERAARQMRLQENPEVVSRIAKVTQAALAREYVDHELEGANKLAPSFEKLAEENYLAALEKHRRPAGVLVSHILIKIDLEDPRLDLAVVQKRAEDLLAEIRAGADFASLARKKSEDRATAINGGRIKDWASRGTLVPPFEEAAFALKKGEVSNVVRTRFGYHIIKLDDARPEVQIPFAEVKDRLVESLRSEYLATKKKELLARFAGTKPVVIDDNAWASIKALAKAE